MRMAKLIVVRVEQYLEHNPQSTAIFYTDQKGNWYNSHGFWLNETNPPLAQELQSYYHKNSFDI